MKSAVSIVVLASVCSFSRWAAAQETAAQETAARQAVAREEAAVDLGVNLGYAIPLGAVMGGSGTLSFSEVTSGAIPFGLDVNYRVAPNVAVGAYGQYAVAFLPEDRADLCKQNDLDCSVSNIRAGLQASYIAGFNGLEAWAGLTLGVERMSLALETSEGESHTTLMTLPDVGVKGGVSFEVSPVFAVGPFVGLSMGRFSYGRIRIPSQTAHVHIPSEDRRFHQWLTLGLRAAFTL